MEHSDELRRCLETCDIVAARRLWAHVAPHLPQPETDQAALCVVHHARTQARSISIVLRAYSHRWLLDHGLPSGLPDALKPRAERMFPEVIEGVGIAVKTTSSILRPIGLMVRGAMEDAVQDVYASSRKPPAPFVKARVMEARGRMQKLVVEATHDLGARR